MQMQGVCVGFFDTMRYVKLGKGDNRLCFHQWSRLFKLERLLTWLSDAVIGVPIALAARFIRRRIYNHGSWDRGWNARHLKRI